MIGSTRNVRVRAAPQRTCARATTVSKRRARSRPAERRPFLFVNRSRRSCNVLYWNGTGLCIFIAPPEGEAYSVPQTSTRGMARS
ncbi:MAG: IS66 family insertion sequence element accessory protein TnpB [Sandaracinus sp.]|nr:IS66 family insertion sequence element accessory protein TnpB [Sandaracinus sp.]MCB9612282.1 IS66 family insertion sequence element accessory protein TnpB [Sandaracinus sp.]MCB9621032.1 IS66 family insertion sequence element accessory protein TnpB [Sandaracinus sp.]